MAKVHPNSTASSSEARRKKAEAPPSSSPESGGEAAVLTVWRKSLLFNCSGFTVFDDKGNLFFRVDNYSSGKRAEVVLMDAAGRPLLSIRRKRLSLSEQWLVYEGEDSTAPLFSVKKPFGFLQPRALARVAPIGGRFCGYEVEGSFSRRSCAVYDGRRRRVAEITRKESAGGVGFGGDVFRLVVLPGLDSAVAMAIVILLDQMFPS
ncbi:unnamed protein product [Spirodela intermedia]|uniref:Uncharacterized protein n=2 Tax=Spirodela intermedia TaxID=51605 RepID=A0A7I8K5U4_SPIIN|nr:unnamed protein product [Spirodela intermedia]CAA6656979.1 unnamed protein product [Spirodela intermedia]CAA7392957.1 unnamed protein product [Spirodela intermedia]CAB1184513.1 unnamed protein product [Spirodela intermedia]